MTNRISKKHHYLPRCYLKGFTHNGKQLFIYDKLKDEVRPGNIENSFTLWGRNTVTLPDGSRSDFIEKAYADIETQAAYLFPKMINSTPNSVPYTVLDKLMLGLFVAALFWRVPGMDQHTRKLIEDEGFENRKFHLEYPEGWSNEDRQKMEALLLSDPAFQKSYAFLLMFEPFLEKGYSSFLEGWKFYYHDPGVFFAGDVPTITRGATEPKRILEEFILPLAPNRILVATTGKPSRIERDWSLDVNLQLINQAERYVCSNNEEFLKAIVGLYKSESISSSSHLVDKIFKVVD